MIPIYNIQRCLLAMGLILATTACQDSLEVPVQETPTDPTHLRIEVTSNDETKALLSGKYLPSGSKIGVYFQGDGSNGEYDGNLYQNVFVTASGSDASQTWTIDPSHPIRLSGSQGCAYAYYPYDVDASSPTAINISATDGNDYLFAVPVDGISTAQPEARFSMKHALSILRLKILPGTYTGTGSITKVSAQGNCMGLNGNMDILHQTVQAFDPAIQVASNVTKALSSSPLYEFLVVPSGSEMPIEFRLTLDNQVYTVTSAPITLESGQVYLYTLSVMMDGIKLSPVELTDWNAPQNIADTDMTLYNPTIPWSEAKQTDGIYGVDENGLAVPYADVFDEYYHKGVGVAMVFNGTAYQIANQSADRHAWGATDVNTSLQDYTRVGGGVLLRQGYLPLADGSYSSQAGSNNKITGTWTDWSATANTALSDLSGKTSTETLMTEQNGQTNCIATTIQTFRQDATRNQGKGDWFCPSAAQMAFIHLKRAEIDAVIGKIQENQPSATTVSGKVYWTSTEYDTGNAWFISLTNGNIDTQGDFGDNKVVNYYIRPIREL